MGDVVRLSVKKVAKGLRYSERLSKAAYQAALKVAKTATEEAVKQKCGSVFASAVIVVVELHEGQKTFYTLPYVCKDRSMAATTLKAALELAAPLMLKLQETQT